MIVALDLETSGVDNKVDKIIEIAMIKFDEKTFEVIDTFSTLINPGFEIPELISNITNIFTIDVENAPKFDEEIIKKVTDFIGDLPILGHNTYFDRDFLIQNGVDLEKNIVLDTFVLANIILINEKSLNLQSILESFNLELAGAHRALNDVLGTIEVFKKLIEIFKNLTNKQKQLLNTIFMLCEHKSFEFYRKLFYFDFPFIEKEDFIKEVLKVVKKYDSKDFEIKSLEIDAKIEDIFSNLKDFEVRQNQLNMSLKVDESFKKSKKVVIQAPTGVGKTFAYLIPSVVNSLNDNIQVIISTNTKALQDQIFYKDLDFLSKNLGYDFTFTKLKGKKNYLSITRFLDSLFFNDFLGLDETMFYSKIMFWLFFTEYGELEELNFNPREFSYLKNINADNFFILSDKNDFKHYEFLFKARIKAQNSNIVIINHSLLLQDINSTSPIFGQIKNLIVDESHNLEDSTTDALKSNFAINSLFETFSRLKTVLNKSNSVIDNLDILEKNLTTSITLLFDLLSDYATSKNTYSNDVFDVLIENDFFENNSEVQNLLNTIEIGFIELINKMSVLSDELYQKLKTEIQSFEDYNLVIKKALSKDFLNYISVFNFNKNYNHQLYFTLLNPGDFLKKNLWDKLDNLLLTSATLEVKNSFDYIKNILNLKEDFEFLSLESDFDYSKQALLFIPNDLGSIKYNNPKINDFLLKFFEIVGGNSMVLLTSFSSIKDLYLSLNIPLKKKNINILAQSLGGSKHKIANYFKNHANNSIILGTDSFWEGVDIPGNDLSYLVIHKFPFMVPSDPIFKARSKLFKDSFGDYSIPKAIIKTKQGFGRLIRTKSDNGIVILLDDRIYSTNWGAELKSSFPNDINIKMGSSSNFLDLIKQKQEKKNA